MLLLLEEEEEETEGGGEGGGESEREGGGGGTLKMLQLCFSDLLLLLLLFLLLFFLFQGEAAEWWACPCKLTSDLWVSHWAAGLVGAARSRRAFAALHCSPGRSGFLSGFLCATRSVLTRESVGFMCAVAFRGFLQGRETYSADQRPVKQSNPAAGRKKTNQSSSLFLSFFFSSFSFYSSLLLFTAAAATSLISCHVIDVFKMWAEP